MPIDRDNKDEREARIDALLAQLAEQKRRLLDQGSALWRLTEQMHGALARPALAPPVSKLN
jgi:hypothetical protein